MATQLATRPQNGADVIENVLLNGDLDKLTPDQRLAYYRRVCETLGLNEATQPFQYIRLSGKLVLYARKDATEQLRKRHGVSIVALDSKTVEDVYVVTAHAKAADGRLDQSTGAVSLAGLKGEALANALMKAETKAKRRVTLSICGLGMLDETEVETIPGAQVVTTEVDEAPPQEEARAETFDRVAMEASWAVLVEEAAQHKVQGSRWAKNLDISLISDEELTEKAAALRERIEEAKQVAF